MKRIVSILGVISVLLGGLWLLQGFGVVHVPPLLCVAECTPIEGGSPIWAAVGAVFVVAGALAITWTRRRSDPISSRHTF